MNDDELGELVARASAIRLRHDRGECDPAACPHPDHTVGDFEVLRQLWEITEYRDGMVYRTLYIGDVWVPMAWRDACPLPDHLFASMPTGYEGPTIRRAIGPDL